MLEEHTLGLARAYRRDEGNVSLLFTAVHTLHAIDEARHCVFDGAIAEWLLADQSPLARRVTAAVLDASFRAYYDTSWGHDRPVLQLARDFPELAPRAGRLIAAVQNARGAAFLACALDPAESPVAARAARRFPMLGDALDDLSRPGAS